MKADLTLPDNQAFFMAQYLGQYVLSNGKRCLVGCYLDKMVVTGNIDPLSLRHISSLSEEEIKRLVILLGYVPDAIGMTHCKDTVNRFISSLNNGGPEWGLDVFKIKQACDMLIELGFLIPWRGNSCDDLIASGVAVYREERKEGA